MNKNKFDAVIGEGRVNAEKVLLAKPQTYMNLSGNSVKQILDFYKINPENLIVIYDDIDIELGKIRVKKEGGPGTHNGMRNIVNMIASEKFMRIRVGTDKPKFGMNLADYVLMKFTKEEEELINKATINAADATLKIINDGISNAMNEFNGL